MPLPPPIIGNPSNVRIHSQIVEPPHINSPIRGEQPSYSTYVSLRSLPGMVSSTTVAQGIHEAEAPPPIPSPDEQIHLEDIPSRLPVISTTRTVPTKFIQLFIVNCWLVFFSIWGNLARLGFIRFTDYQGTPVGGGQSRGNGVLWANFAGCVIIGYLTENLELFQVGGRHKAEEPQPTAENENDPEPGPNNNSGPNTPETPMPLYIGLTTGFCGSFTSFSSYMLQAFLYLSNTLPSYTHPQKGYSVLSFLGYIVLTLALSVSGLQFGGHIAEFTKSHIRFIPLRATKLLDKMIPFLSLTVWAGSIIMAILIPEWRGNVLFACVFSPVGTLTRFWVSRILNPKAKRFPLGTFMVNIFGTAVLAGAVIGQYGHNWRLEAGGLLGCQLMRGVGDGFCGCLTTVSTWVVEIRALRRHHAYQYALSTITAGTLTMLIILGSYIWRHENLHTVNGTC